MSCCKGWTNVARNQNFITVLLRLLAKSKFDAVVGFNKMPGLDIYFAADPCFEAKAKTKNKGLEGAGYQETDHVKKYYELARM